MKSSHTLTCLPKKYMLPILSQFSMEIEVTENPYNLPINDLFAMAARINKKRSFLFVSKVLGKHIPIDPKKGILIGALLANRYVETIDSQEPAFTDKLVSAFLKDSNDSYLQPFIDKHRNPVIIGFAETATALGHAFYQFFQQADFFHTTREMLVNEEPVISFEEEHSHATSHRCYIDEALLNNNREMILVDDEITTGKTAINIIRSIQTKFPRQYYTVVSILDWRSEASIQEFNKLEKELGISIEFVSLLRGRMKQLGSPVLEKRSVLECASSEVSPAIQMIALESLSREKLTSVSYPSITLSGEKKDCPYIKETGRFGINTKMNEVCNRTVEEIGGFLKTKRSGKNTLCIGTGEFMFIPMKVASLMGSGVSFQSTTRSPIYVNQDRTYGAKYGFSFPNPEDQDISHYIYNIAPNLYDEMFIFFERAVSQEELKPMLEQFKKTNIKDIKVVFFSGGIENE